MLQETVISIAMYYSHNVEALSHVQTSCCWSSRQAVADLMAPHKSVGSVQMEQRAQFGDDVESCFSEGVRLPT